VSVNPRGGGKPEVTPTAFGSDAADFVYFDGAVAYGSANGIIQAELAATVRMPVKVHGKDQVRSRVIVVAHLRTSVEGAMQLMDTLSKALALPKPGDKAASTKQVDG
jgi:hypothetical protein